MDRWCNRDCCGRCAITLDVVAHRNTRAGSRRNIAAHYDLSNEFFALMLDPTMTYSSGIFEQPDATLEAGFRRQVRSHLSQAAVEADRPCTGDRHRLGRIRPACGPAVRLPSDDDDDFAAAVCYWPRTRIREAGLEDRIDLLLRDYRDLRGPVRQGSSRSR